MFAYDKSTSGHFLHTALNHTPVVGCEGRSIVKELAERGYDITTLRFSIRKKGSGCG